MREKLAEYAHAAWSGWMKYLFEKSTQNADGTVTIPAWAVSRWQRQMNTPYEALLANEKESDGVEADRMIAIMSSYLTPAAPDDGTGSAKTANPKSEESTGKEDGSQPSPVS